MRTSIASALVLAVLGIGLMAPAGATARAVVARDEQTFRTTVHFGDLDLQTRQGAGTLYSRLNLAASHVCSETMEPYLKLTRAYGACRREAVSAAVRQIDRPLLTQAYDQHLPKYPSASAAHHTTPYRAPHA